MGIYLSLGSNVGNRQAQLEKALAMLPEVQDKRSSCRVLHISPCYETTPWGVLEQPNFLNLAVEIETAMTPLEFLRHVKWVESALGRELGLRWGPRAIDIDMVLWHALVLETPELILPHVAFRERRFVLTPLADIAPEAQDPVTGRTVRELLAILEREETHRASVERPEIWLYTSP